MNEQSRIKYSVVIPIKEVNNYLYENISRIKSENRRDVEIIVLPNSFEGSISGVKVVETGRIGPGKKRDVGSDHALGEWLIFLDDDSYPANDYFGILDNLIAKFKGVYAYGGPGITPPQDGFWQRVSGAVFTSKWTGGFPERYISVEPVKSVLDWPSVNLVINKSYFFASGRFDTNYWPGEDSILCEKLQKIECSIQYRPELVVWHHRRPGLFAHMKQTANYGLHRGYFFKKNIGLSRKIKYLIPSLMVGYIFLSAYIVIQGKFEYLLNVWWIYLFIIILGLIDINRHERGIVAVATLPYIVATHISYGVMFLVGLYKKELTSKLR
jgi:glycosyltransferase involved in cell wall biosynthesis